VWAGTAPTPPPPLPKPSFRSEKRRPLHATGTLEGLGSHVIVVDTVGFISELPTQLVAAFRSTLQQILDADVLVHVRDVSAPSFEQQKQAAPPRNERAATCILLS
jgi:predicted GTPase